MTPPPEPDPTLQRVAGVYVIRCLANGAAYVGSSRDVGRRFAEHRFALEAGLHSAGRLQADWRRLGPDAFEWRLACALPPDDGLLELHERAEMLRRHAFARGYNRRVDVFRGASRPLARLRALIDAQPWWARRLGLAPLRARRRFARELAALGIEPRVAAKVAAWYEEDRAHLERYPAARGPRLWRRAAAR